MSKWVNIYLLVLLANIVSVIFFSPSVLLSLPLLILASIVVYLSRVNQTTSIVHLTMFAISIFFVALSFWSVIYE